MTELEAEAESSDAAARGRVVLGSEATVYPAGAMRAVRTNQEWVRDLAAEGPARQCAIDELRRYLMRALPGAMKRYGALPEHLLEDVVQDSLIRILDHLDRFEGRSRFTTWAMTIAVRTALTELRRRRWKDVTLEELRESGRDFSEDLRDRAASPETRAAQLAILRALQKILDDELSERQRIAILAEFSGMPQEEIGRRLGISRNAVYKLGHDARKKLKRGLEAIGCDAAAIRAAFSQDRS